MKSTTGSFPASADGLDSRSRHGKVGDAVPGRHHLEPGKRSGQPCIRGMRITVYDVLSYLAAGMTPEEILEDFPYLRKDDILACLSYAADRERRTLAVSA